MGLVGSEELVAALVLDHLPAIRYAITKAFAIVAESIALNSLRHALRRSRRGATPVGSSKARAVDADHFGQLDSFLTPSYIIAPPPPPPGAAARDDDRFRQPVGQR
jgi:hypothetical protein